MTAPEITEPRAYSTDELIAKVEDLLARCQRERARLLAEIKSERAWAEQALVALDGDAPADGGERHG